MQQGVVDFRTKTPCYSKLSVGQHASVVNLTFLISFLTTHFLPKSCKEIDKILNFVYYIKTT